MRVVRRDRRRREKRRAALCSPALRRSRNIIEFYVSLAAATTHTRSHAPPISYQNHPHHTQFIRPPQPVNANQTERISVLFLVACKIEGVPLDLTSKSVFTLYVWLCAVLGLAVVCFNNRFPALN